MGPVNSVLVTYLSINNVSVKYFRSPLIWLYYLFLNIWTFYASVNVASHDREPINKAP